MRPRKTPMKKTKKIVPEGWFKWERPDIDFPFYNDDAVPDQHAWLLIGASLLVAVLLNILPFFPGDKTIIKVIIVFLIPLAALLFVARGDIGTIIKRPRLGDIPLIIIVVVLEMAFSIAIGQLLQVIGMPASSNPLMGETMSAWRIALVFVQLFGEELFKTNMLLGILLLMFRRTGDRKKAVIIATLITLLIFGLAHYAAYGSILQILLIQGLGSVICQFAYLKTKNMLVTYVAHLIFDLIPIGFVLLAPMAGALLLS